MFRLSVSQLDVFVEFGETTDSKATQHLSKFHTLLDCRHMAANQKRVTALLRSIPKEAFADSLMLFEPSALNVTLPSQSSHVGTIITTNYRIPHITSFSY
jgi:hypothetical protein